MGKYLGWVGVCALFDIARWNLSLLGKEIKQRTNEKETNVFLYEKFHTPLKRFEKVSYPSHFLVKVLLCPLILTPLVVPSIKYYWPLSDSKKEPDLEIQISSPFIVHIWFTWVNCCGQVK